MKRFRIAVLAAVFVIICMMSGCSANENRIGMSVTIDNIDVAQLTEAEAYEKLSYHYAKQTYNTIITITDSNGNSVSERADALGLDYDVRSSVLAAIDMSYIAWNGRSGRNIDTEMIIDTAKLRSKIDEIAKKFTVSPEQATFAYNPDSDGFFDFVPEKIGYKVDTDMLYEKVYDALSGKAERNIEIELTQLMPTYTLDDAKSDCSLLGEFSTSFGSGSLNNPGRVKNIVKGAGLIDGYAIAPGESFDINKVLGPRNETNGWFVAPGIVKGKYEPEYGGGICQVSTTLYNAALLSGMEIVERHHHSWPMSYAPMGQDATITTGGLNLILRNTSDKTVIVSALVNTEKQSITVRMFGRKTDDPYTRKLVSKKIKTIAQPEDEYKLDSSLASNTVKEFRSGREGVISETYMYYYDKNGDVIKKELISKDTYRALSTIYYVSEDMYYSRFWEK